MLNGMPAPTIDTPGYTTAKCLLPYPVCKLQWAIVSALAAAEQLVMGGDVEGARSTTERGFGGDWLLRPEHVSGDPLWSVPLSPVTFGAAIVTGRGNVGTRTIDPFPSAKRDESDVLPP
jgi:hypothetical protein